MRSKLLQKNIILQFWKWYYSGAIKSLLNIWRNFIIFVREYYSIPLLFRTLFSPWRRDITRYKKGFSLKNFFETLSFNLISRGLGFLIRSITIFIGLICLLLVVLLGISIIILWIILPAILLFLIFIGVWLLKLTMVRFFKLLIRKFETNSLFVDVT